jgi:hypothetical protein
MSKSAELMEVRVTALRNLFNPLDPSPLTERDLDPRIEEFMVSWARSSAFGAPLALRVSVSDDVMREESDPITNSIHRYFARESESAQRRLTELFRLGRTSLLIGLAALVLAFAAGALIEDLLAHSRFGEMLRETFIIGGWVAMWRPLEIFLYDWWPIRDTRELYSRLSKMPVDVRGEPRTTN